MNLKISKKTVGFFALFFMADHCLWIVNANAQSIAYEMCWIGIFALFVISFARKGFKNVLDRTEYNFSSEVLFTIVMGIYSSVQSYRLHGQSLAQGIVPQRFMIWGFLFYFVLMKYLNKKENALYSLKRMFLLLGYLELFLYILQYLSIDYFQFLQITYTIRLDEIRMNPGTIALPFVIFNSINHIYSNKKATIKDILLIGAGFFYSFGIAKTRIVLLAYIIAIIGGFLVWKNSGKKKVVVFFVLVFVITILAQTELFSFMLDGLNNLDKSSQTRELGREYYLSKIEKHPILGCGYINTNNAQAVAFSGMNSLKEGVIAWVDLGIYGLTFFFGIIGFIWFIILYGKMAYKSFAVAKNGNSIYWMYMIYSIVICPNGTGFLWNIGSTMGLVWWMCMIEKEYKMYQNNIVESLPMY